MRLRAASDEVLNRVPARALVALQGILSADRYTTLEEVLANPPHENVVEAVVGEAGCLHLNVN